jgi:phosphoglycolate phosphatase-like HAD superfamily hydrolase
VSVAVFDIDGVVADVRHRLRHLERPRKDWDRFFASASTDPPLAPGLALVAELAQVHDIVWLTGRPERIRRVTTDWLSTHDLPTGELRMRGDADRRPAALFKVGVLRRLAPMTVAAFVDDDDDVVRAALAAGFPAVLADWVIREPILRQAQDRSGRT